LTPCLPLRGKDPEPSWPPASRTRTAGPIAGVHGPSVMQDRIGAAVSDDPESKLNVVATASAIPGPARQGCDAFSIGDDGCGRAFPLGWPLERSWTWNGAGGGCHGCERAQDRDGHRGEGKGGEPLRSPCAAADHAETCATHTTVRFVWAPGLLPKRHRHGSVESLKRGDHPPVAPLLVRGAKARQAIYQAASGCAADLAGSNPLQLRWRQSISPSETRNCSIGRQQLLLISQGQLLSP